MKKQLTAFYLVVVFALLVVSVIMFSGIACAGPLHDAAFAGDIGKVRQLLKQGADVNARDEFQRTPLHCAAIVGRTEVAKLLIEKGADVNAMGISRETPAMYAKKWNHPEFVAMLRGALGYVVPDGFMGIPWGASKDQIIKTMRERGLRQVTSEESNSLEFINGDFAGVPCYMLSFSLTANAFHRGSAEGCQRSPHHGVTQTTFISLVNTLSEKYGTPQHRESGKMDGEDHHMHFVECKGSGYPTGRADWDFVDSRSDQYEISIVLDVSVLHDMTEKPMPCRVDIFIWYRAESLGKRLEKKDY